LLLRLRDELPADNDSFKGPVFFCGSLLGETGQARGDGEACRDQQGNFKGREWHGFGPEE
jgi:hypothetical protein